MEDLKKIVGKNLIELRKNKHLTQFELAEKMNYSDKSISKWENGDTLPDLETLNNLCKFYGVTIDYLTHDEHANKAQFIIPTKQDTANKILITCLIDSMIWMLATIIFVYNFLLKRRIDWVLYVYSVPLTVLLTTFFLRKYFVMNRLKYFILWTVFLWTLLASVFCGFLVRNIILWPLFILGIPAEISLGIWAFIKK